MNLTINSVLEEFDKEFRVNLRPINIMGDIGPMFEDEEGGLTYVSPDKIKSFLRSALSKTCDEILAVVPERGCGGSYSVSATTMAKCGDGFSCRRCQGWNAARKAIESKIRELKG